jgi:hypothetical protein
MASKRKNTSLNSFILGEKPPKTQAIKTSTAPQESLTAEISDEMILNDQHSNKIQTSTQKIHDTLHALILHEENVAPENAAKIDVDHATGNAPHGAINGAIKSSAAGAPTTTSGAAQTANSVAATSPAETNFISLADSASAHSHENVLPMDLALSENPPSTSANSNDFTTVVKRHHSKPLPQATIERLGRTVYLTGHQVNLAKVIAIDHAEDFQHAIDESIKITCSSQEQKDQFIQIESVLGHNIKVTLPHCITKTDNQQIKKRSTTPSVWKKGVIKTPLHFNQAFLKAHTGAVWTHRITIMRDGKISETPSVILAFEENIPNKIQIGLYSFKVEPYIPKPIRCGNCQRYGHKSRDCNKSTHTCPRCAGNHQVTACNSGTHATKCVNCGGNHSAAYKGCIKYKTIATALKSTVTEGLTYSEALKKNKIHLRPNNISNQAATSKQITTPTKQDSSTQTESNTATQTDIPNHDLAEIVKATVDTVNWLLGQIKVTANQKSLLEALQKQYAIFTTLIDSKNPSTTFQIPGNKGATKNVASTSQT